MIVSSEKLVTVRTPFRMPTVCVLGCHHSLTLMLPIPPGSGEDHPLVTDEEAEPAEEGPWMRLGQSEDGGRHAPADSQASHFRAASLTRKHARETHLPV